MAARVHGPVRRAAGPADRRAVTRHATHHARVPGVSDSKPAPPLRAARRTQMTHRLQRKLIDRHFEGTGAPAGEHSMRAHLVDCSDYRAHYERHLHLVAIDPQAALPRRERLARGLGLSSLPARTRSPRWWFVLAVPAAAACAVALFAVGLLRTAPEPQPRGGPASKGSQLLVYEIPKGAAARQAAGEVRADSALAFAYANIAHRRHLMVFAVDEARRVYWYHPAWQDPADDPVAVDVARDDAVHELPHAITHRFAGRRLRVFGVFADRALSVRQIEALVARAPVDDQGRLQIVVPEAEVRTLDVAVATAR